MEAQILEEIQVQLDMLIWLISVVIGLLLVWLGVKWGI